MSRGLSQLLVALSLLSCAPGSRGPVVMSRAYADADEGGGGFQVRGDTLFLPASGELSLFPRTLFLRGVTTEAAEFEDPSRVRFQAAMRVIRKDGGVRQWWLGADSQATVGEGGFYVARDGLVRGVTQSFDGMRLGPVRLDSVAALQVLVSEVVAPGHAGDGRWLAGAALRPEALRDGPVTRAVAGGVHEAGGALRLAVHVPVESLGWNFYAIADLDQADSVDKIGAAAPYVCISCHFEAGTFRINVIFPDMAPVAPQEDSP